MASSVVIAAAALVLATPACSGDDPPATTGSGGSGGAAGGSGGSGGRGGSGSGGVGGNPGSGGSTGGSSGGTGGSAGAGTGGSSSGVDAAPGGDSGGGATDAPPGAAAGPERFVGEWDYTSGGAQLACPGQQTVMQSYQGAFATFAAGSGVAPLIYLLPGCSLRFDVQGQAAVVQPGQTCSFAIGGRPNTSRPDTHTFTLDGNQLREMSSWTVTFTATPTAPCTLTTQGVLTKAP